MALAAAAWLLSESIARSTASAMPRHCLVLDGEANDPHSNPDDARARLGYLSRPLAMPGSARRLHRGGPVPHRGRRSHGQDCLLTKPAPTGMTLCLANDPDGIRQAAGCAMTPIGWKDPRSRDGELAWPERFDRVWVDNIKAALGQDKFSNPGTGAATRIAARRQKAMTDPLLGYPDQRPARSTRSSATWRSPWMTRGIAHTAVKTTMFDPHSASGP